MCAHAGHGHARYAPSDRNGQPDGSRRDTIALCYARAGGAIVPPHPRVETEDIDPEQLDFAVQTTANSMAPNPWSPYERPRTDGRCDRT